MNFDIPKPLQVEHEALHAMLVDATREAGAVGEAAREVARLLHPHFVREEEFAAKVAVQTAAVPAKAKPGFTVAPVLAAKNLLSLGKGN